MFFEKSQIQLFANRYKIHPIYRGPGFAGTAIPTLISLTLISYFQFFQGTIFLFKKSS